jgi:hypothetical protein
MLGKREPEVPAAAVPREDGPAEDFTMIFGRIAIRRLPLLWAPAVIATVIGGCGGSGTLDVSGQEAESLLFQAAQDPRWIEEFYALVNAGVDLNASDASGRTAMHYAVAGDNGEAVRVLLLSGADPTLRDAHGRTAHDLAEQEHKMSAIQAFDRFDKLATVR